MFPVDNTSITQGKIYKSVAFIPARSGSERVPNKNIRRLHNHPLLAYSIIAAIESGAFDQVVCVTDSKEYASIAEHYGAAVPGLRSSAISSATSPDIDWLIWCINLLGSQGHHFDWFGILRPTSPFRKPQTIQRCVNEFLDDHQADSIRAVEYCSQHPGKMWLEDKGRLKPLLPWSNRDVPWHSCQYADLPVVYVQNASLELAWTRVVENYGNISGHVVRPFFTSGYEGFDVNTKEDFERAEIIANRSPDVLPSIETEAWRN